MFENFDWKNALVTVVLAFLTTLGVNVSGVVTQPTNVEQPNPVVDVDACVDASDLPDPPSVEEHQPEPLDVPEAN